MKKIFKRIKNVYLNRIISLIILQTFLISSVNVYPAAANDNKDKKDLIKVVKNITNNIKDSLQNKEDRKTELKISYSFDAEKDILYIAWNRSLESGKKYYVYKKAKGNNKYRLISTKDGINENFYVTTLKDNVNASIVVCESPELPKIPNDVKIYSPYDMGDYVGLFKELKGSQYTESNIIEIKLDSKYANKDEIEKYIVAVSDQEKEEKKNGEKVKGLKGEKEGLIKEKLEKISEEVKRTCALALMDKNGEKPEGFFTINDNRYTKIQYKGITLEIPADAASTGSYVYIKTLNKEELVDNTNASPNITYIDGITDYAGYDITLNGDAKNIFTKEIKISIKYDNKKIPGYANKGSAFIYYFDENNSQWKYLKREKLANNIITSKTSHFCQFYAGAMTVQSEPPQAKGINTSPKNIQKIDSLAGIKNINPPEPNYSGSANLSYPISVPEGINKLTPKLSINYSSDAGFGNCGVGWGISLSSITIKTKNNGVPKYDGNDILMLDERELVKINAETYRFKVEGSFSKIEKNGDGFIVYETDGTRMFYGENDNTRLSDPNNPSHIFIWKLSHIVDKFGNQIKYEYQDILENSIRVNSLISKISYGYDDIYTVNFTWEDRPDIRTNYRGGFRININKRLKDIIVRYNTTELKKEELVYEVNLQNMNILKNIREIVNNEVINDHRFEYETYNNGWESRSAYAPPYHIVNGNNNGEDLGARFEDLNGDGLIDMVWHRYLSSGSSKGAYINTGSGWVSKPEYIPPYHLVDGNNNGTDLGARFIDLNGDGLIDMVWHRYLKSGSSKGAYINTGSNLFLTSITNNKTNVSTDLEYSQIPVPLIGQKKVLSSITTGNTDLSLTTTVEYENGIVDRLEKEFRGFEKVISKLVDTVKNVTHISETIYRVNDIIGYDSYNNPIYDEYIKGQVDTVSSLFDNGSSLRTLNKQKYIYQKDEILTGYSDVKFVYPKETRVWIYDDNGNYLGNNDILAGDKGSEVNYTYDLLNGIIIKANSFDYLDPHHNYDDVQSIVDHTANLAKWISLPYKVEQIDVRNTSRISLKTIYYDNQSEGALTNGILSSERVWNNNGPDAITTFQFDGLGNSTNITGPNGLSISTVTNYLANNDYYIEITKTFPDGLTEITRQDIYGRIKEAVDTYGDITKIFMDNYGRVIKVVEPQDTEASPTKEIIYDTNSGYFRAVAKYKDESADNYLTIQYYKDGLGREIQTKNEGYINGNRVWIVSGKSIYDSMGRIISTGSVSTTDFINIGYIDAGIIEPVTNYHYDEFGRLNQTDSPTGFIIYNFYEKFIDTDNTPDHPYNRILGGAVVSDSAGHIKKTYKDLSKQEVKTQTIKEDSTYAATEMVYDLHGYAKVIESDNSTTGLKQADSLGRMMYIKRPDAGKIEYQYNNLGLVDKVLDYGKNEADWREVNYSYDSLNRISNIDYPGTDNDIRYIYYGIDASVPKYSKSAIKEINKGATANPYYKVEYLYDQFWIKESKTINASLYETTYEYDMQGRIKNLTYPDGEIVRYYYDEGSFLTRIQGNEIYIDEIRYNEFGQRAYLKYGNGSEMTYTYDPNSRLLDIFTTKDMLGNEILRYDYDFNSFGNITSISDNPNGTANAAQNYQYDLLNRLVNADGNYKNGIDTYNQNYQYDDDNRIIQKNYGNGMIYDFHYISNTHAVSYIDVTNGNNGTTKINFNYDDYGNMIQKEMSAGTVPLETDNYIYDESNKLVNIDNGVTELNFKYDNKGQRIKKVFEDEVGIIKETIYVNGFYLISDGRTDKHISDGKYIVATKLNNDQNDIYYYHSNHIGSTAAMTKADGQKFQKYHYYPYGEMWQKEESAADENLNILYAGAYFDQESGLYYMNARYYDPEIGMFMNPDPGMDGLNHYAYANCNPIMFSDPTGMYVPIAEIIITIVAIIIAAVVGTVCAYVANHNGGQGSAASVTGSGSVGIGSGSSSSGGSSSDGGVSSSGGGSGGGGNSNDKDPSDKVVVNESDYSGSSNGAENNYVIFSYNVYNSVLNQEESTSGSLNVNEEAILEALVMPNKAVVNITAQNNGRDKIQDNIGQQIQDVYVITEPSTETLSEYKPNLFRKNPVSKWIGDIAMLLRQDNYNPITRECYLGGDANKVREGLMHQFEIAAIGWMAGAGAGLKTFSKGGDAWHYGLEYGNQRNIIHIGNNPKFSPEGIHVAVGNVGPKFANFHFYLTKSFPFFRFWKP